ncbi:MAG: pyrroline-5-carboxylate reductase [Clostridia bacterium]|nr:pyrroline-5-carboxylate reductase [Clostridia bacterium]
MSHYKNLLFIGGGNIAGAVACGLVSSGTIPAKYVTVYDIDASKFTKFNELGINTTTELSVAVNDAEIVFLAVKPAIVKSVMKQLSEFDNLLERVVFVSFAAAVSIKHIVESAGRNIAVIRTMPSTPILVGEGVLAITHNELVNTRDFEFFCRMMSAISHIAIIDEAQMNPIISVHGSSPAYVYLFVKSMLDAAEKQGISNEVALPLILKTIKGSVTMIEKSSDSIEQLIKNVASPNGTTLAALNSFYDDDFSGAIDRAMNACTKRADEIALEL